MMGSGTARPRLSNTTQARYVFSFNHPRPMDRRGRAVPLPSRRDHAAIEALRQGEHVGFHKCERCGVGAEGNPVRRTQVGGGLHDIV